MYLCYPALAEWLPTVPPHRTRPYALACLWLYSVLLLFGYAHGFVPSRGAEPNNRSTE